MRATSMSSRLASKCLSDLLLGSCLVHFFVFALVGLALIPPYPFSTIHLVRFQLGPLSLIWYFFHFTTLLYFVPRV
jgi:hypothetical protein